MESSDNSAGLLWVFRVSVITEWLLRTTSSSPCKFRSDGYARISCWIQYFNVVCFDAVGVSQFTGMVFRAVFHCGDDLVYEDDGNEKFVVIASSCLGHVWVMRIGEGRSRSSEGHPKEISMNPLPNLLESRNISLVNARVDARVVNGGGL
jgi:hypothetical protein